MGGKTSTSSSQVQIPPEVLARYNSVNATAEQTAATPFQQYSTDPNAFVAPVNAQQTAGIAGTNAAANQAQPYFGAATAYTAAGGQAVDPNQIGGQQINQFLSPFLGDVYGATLAGENQQNAQQASSLQGTAIGAGAFGGDRSGVAAANLAYQQNLANSQTNANILNTGFNTALSTAQQQQGVNLGAEQANRAALQQTGQSLAGLGAGAQTAALQGAQAQLGAGAVQQQTTQAGDTALYNQFLQQQAYPFQTTQFLANIAEGTGALSGSTTNTTQPSSLFSDERLKEDIEPIGKTFDGQNIVKFRYKGEKGKQIGFIAQEVEKHHPDAVGLARGYKTVDYDQATRKAASRGHFYRGGLALASDADQGFAFGGTPTLPGPYAGMDLGALLQAQQQSQAGVYGAAGRGMYGTPGAGGYVPAANGPVGHLAQASPPPQQQAPGLLGGLAAVGNAGDKVEKDWDAGKGLGDFIDRQTAPDLNIENYSQNPLKGETFSPDQSIANLTGADSPARRGGRVGRATGGDTPYAGADGYVPSNTAQTAQQLAVAKPPGQQQSGLGSLLGGIGQAAGAVKGIEGLGSAAASAGSDSASSPSRRGGRVSRDSGGSVNSPDETFTPPGLGGSVNSPDETSTPPGLGGAQNPVPTKENIPDDSSHPTLAAANPPSGGGGGNSTLGDIGKIAGIAAMFFSDERLKDDIKPIGKTFDGQPIYSYSYKGDGRTQIGLMAQDVEKHHPDAVGLAGGYKTVDYGKATERAAHRGHFYRGGLAGGRKGYAVNGGRIGKAGGGDLTDAPALDTSGIYGSDPSTNPDMLVGAMDASAAQAEQDNIAPITRAPSGASTGPGLGALGASTGPGLGALDTPAAPPAPPPDPLQDMADQANSLFAQSQDTNKSQFERDVLASQEANVRANLSDAIRRKDGSLSWRDITPDYFQSPQDIANRAAQRRTDAGNIIADEAKYNTPVLPPVNPGDMSDKVAPGVGLGRAAAPAPDNTYVNPTRGVTAAGLGAAATPSNVVPTRPPVPATPVASGLDLGAGNDTVSAPAAASPAGGLVPATAADLQGSLTQRATGLNQQADDTSHDWFYRHKDTIVPILSGLGAMASSNSRYLGSALLQGLAGGAQAAVNVQNQENTLANQASTTAGNVGVAQAQTRELQQLVSKGNLFKDANGSFDVLTDNGGPVGTPMPYYTWVANGRKQPLFGQSPATQNPGNTAAGTPAPSQPPIPPKYKDLAKANAYRVGVMGVPDGAGEPGSPDSPWKDISDRANVARAGQLQTNTMISELSKLPATEGGPWSQEVALPLERFANDLLTRAGAPPIPETAGNVGSAELINKIQQAVASVNLANVGGRSQSELAGFKEALPNFGNSPQGRANMAAFMLTQQQGPIDEQQKATIYQNYLSDPSNPNPLSGTQAQAAGRGFHDLAMSEEQTLLQKEYKAFQTIYPAQINGPDGKPVGSLIQYLMNGGRDPDVLKTVDSIAKDAGLKNAKYLLRYFGAAQ